MDAELAALFSLEGRGAVVTGAASGIGRETAITFARAGAKVTLCDVDVAGLDATAELVRAWDPSVTLVRLDVRDRAAVHEVAEAAERRHGLDVWANVAGLLDTSLIVDTTPAQLDRLIDVNIKGVYWGCAAAARIMAARGGGSIINVSSTGADIIRPQISVYALTKAAVNMLTRTLALEAGADGVRVNAVAPGTIETPMVLGRHGSGNGGMDDDAKAALFKARAEVTALKRIGQPIDIATVILFLASDASSYMTGQIVRANGGMSMP